MRADGRDGYNVTKNRLKVVGESTDDAKKWEGWGTALKPANEPICLARKPLSESTVAKNVLRWGTGALNIDASRIGTNGELVHTPQSDPTKRSGEVGKDLGISNAGTGKFQAAQAASVERTNTLGRWPANTLFSQGEATEELERQSGGASRFFYVAKPSRRERDHGVGAAGVGALRDGNRTDRLVANHHPTVKPVALMHYLIRLITPPDGTVLDPFMGSGTTGIAAKQGGFSFVGIEREPEYAAIATARIEAA
jgi:site-specific DNA-methyltransferase (adenine-specific)